MPKRTFEVFFGMFFCRRFGCCSDFSPPTETDGPLGALAIARALTAPMPPAMATLVSSSSSGMSAELNILCEQGCGQNETQALQRRVIDLQRFETPEIRAAFGDGDQPVSFFVEREFSQDETSVLRLTDRILSGIFSFTPNPDQQIKDITLTTNTVVEPFNF